MKRYLLAVLLFLPALTSAQESGVEITPFAGYRFGGTFESTDTSVNYEMEDSSSFGLILNLRHKSNTQWEIFYSQQSSEVMFSEVSDVDQIVDVDIHVLQLGGTYVGDGDKMRPYVAMTLGGTHIRTDSAESADDTFFSGSMGLGMKLMPRSRVGIRVEARAYATFLSSDTKLFCQTGPNQNICAFQVDGNLLSQVEVFAGVSFRF